VENNDLQNNNRGSKHKSAIESHDKPLQMLFQHFQLLKTLWQSVTPVYPVELNWRQTDRQLFRHDNCDTRLWHTSVTYSCDIHLWHSAVTSVTVKDRWTVATEWNVQLTVSSLFCWLLDLALGRLTDFSPPSVNDFFKSCLSSWFWNQDLFCSVSPSSSSLWDCKIWKHLWSEFCKVLLVNW